MAINPNQPTDDLLQPNPALVRPFSALPRIEVPADGNPRANAVGTVYTRYAFAGNEEEFRRMLQQGQQPQQQQPPENRYYRGDGWGNFWQRWAPSLSRAGAVTGAAAILLVPSDPGAEAYFADFPPTDDYERGLRQQAVQAVSAGDDPYRVRRDLFNDVDQHRQERDRQASPDYSGGRGNDNNVEVRGNPCQIGPKGRNHCPSPMNAHHIVPDFVFRLAPLRFTDQRVPGTPSYNDGPTICVRGRASTPGTEHNRIQTLTDSAIGGLDDGTGSARLGDVLREAKRTAAEAVPECAEQIRRAVDEAFAGADPNTLVRTYNGPVRLQRIPSGASP